MPRVATFEAKCQSCGNVFPSPQLSDFAYGEFLLTGTDGTVHAHLVAIDNEAWAVADPVVPNGDVDTLQEVVARLADPVDGQPLTMLHICPSCQSNDWAYWGRDRIGSADIPSATFNKFLALQPVQRKQRVRELLDGLTQ